MDLQQILKKIDDHNIEYVRMEISDLYGVARCKTIPARHFAEKASIGQALVRTSVMVIAPDCSFIHGTGYYDECGYCDSICFPDLDTFAILPWVPNTARVLLDARYKGQPEFGYPREVAKVQCDRLKEMGFTIKAATEHEFVLRNIDTGEPAFGSSQYLSTVRSSFNVPLTQQIERDFYKVGIDIESIEGEYNPGQMEISYKPTFGIRSADIGHTFKTGVKEIARQYNYHANFVTKQDPDDAVGNGAHLNHSLWDADGKVSLFYDANGKYGLSEVAQHWIAGILEHATAVSLLSAPTINCLRRHKVDSWAPMNASWGLDNRSCALRAKVSDQSRTFLENRLPSSAGSPYISLAGMIAAGIDGIQRRLPLPNPVEGSAYDSKYSNIPRLPTIMKDALQGFAEDKIFTDALGKDFVRAFAAAKMHEMECEAKAKAKGDDDWEKDYYSYF